MGSGSSSSYLRKPMNGFRGVCGEMFVEEIINSQKVLGRSGPIPLRWICIALSREPIRLNNMIIIESSRRHLKRHTQSFEKKDVVVRREIYLHKRIYSTVTTFFS